MDRYRLVFALSLGESKLLAFGTMPEIGEYPTSLRLESSLNGLKLSVRGVDIEGPLADIPLQAPLLVEHGEYDVYLHGASPRWLSTAPRADSSKLRYHTSDMSHYSLNYGPSVGDVSLLWRVPEGEVSIGLEVFPTKLDYRKDFVAIKEDLGRLSRLLAVDIAGVTGAGFVSVSQPQEAPVEWLEQVRRESVALRRAMIALLPRLRNQVSNAEVVVPVDRMRGRKPARRRDNALIAAGLASVGVTVRNAELTLATALNGHLRWEVDRFIATGQQIIASDWFAAMQSQFKQVIQETFDAARGWRNELAPIPAVPWLPDLQSRLRDPLYAKAFAGLRRLRLGLQEDQSPELLGLKNLWLLYEYWIYLQIVELLKSRFPRVTSASPSLVQEIEGQIHLVKGMESRITLRDAVGGEINCFYNRGFVNLPTTGQRPDITIEFLPSHELLLVDAKYRLGRSPRYLERYGMVGPEEADINVLHRYRDAIVELNHPYKRPVVGGLIAFPGPDQEHYRDHRFFKSWKKARIGGIPMLPGRVSLMREALDEQILGGY